MARSRYSRLANIEHKKNVRAVYVYGFLSVAIIVILFFFGLPAIVRLAGFLTDLKSSGQLVEIQDKTPPAPPRFDVPAEFTNKSRIELTGTAEAGATVQLFGSAEKETVADDSGRFSFTIPLNKGENSIYAIAIDKNGNESIESTHYTITYDDRQPVVEVTSPADGQTFNGTANQRIEIKGTTESGTNVTVNDRIAIVDSDGNFSLSISLSEGQNTFEIKAQDAAGNEATTSLTVNYTP